MPTRRRLRSRWGSISRASSVINIHKLVREVDVRENLFDVVLQVLDVVRQDILQRERPKAFDCDRVAQVYFFDRFDHPGDMPVVGVPQHDHVVPVSGNPFLQIDPGILLLAWKIQMQLLHHPDEFLLVVTSRIDQVPKDFFAGPFLRGGPTGDFRLMYSPQHGNHVSHNSPEIVRNLLHQSGSISWV